MHCFPLYIYVKGLEGPKFGNPIGEYWTSKLAFASCTLTIFTCTPSISKNTNLPLGVLFERHELHGKTQMVILTEGQWWRKSTP